MAWISKRKSDKARGKQGKYTCFWVGADGKVKSCVGVTEKGASERIAQQKEAEARQVREGIIDPREQQRRAAMLRPLAEHLEDYRLDILARGATAEHAGWKARALTKFLGRAGVESIASFPPERIRAQLARMKQDGLSARTCNSYLTAVKSFLTWLAEAGRIDEVPRGLKKTDRFNEREDRRRVRRALTKDELERLLAAAEAGAPEPSWRPASERVERVGRKSRFISGPERAALYRLAMGTGFRANELRGLTPESFRLDGPEPSVTLKAGSEKNRKGTVQPIRLDLAERLRPFVEGKPPGRPVLPVPAECARILKVDLQEAGIPYRDEKGRVVDFHALRGSFITHLIQDGVNVKVIQKLARHSTITLTMDVYATVEDRDLREALDRGEPEKGPAS